MTSVLIVDDNSKYLKDALPHYGYDVFAANDGVQALKILSQNKFDIILLDVMMPNMNGWDTLKEIRKNVETKDVPVIMITAVNEEEKMISGLRCGADDYIVKPFILQNLLARMEAVLRRTRRQAKEIFPENKGADEFLQNLTAREKEVLKLAAKGANNKQIAEELVLSEVTVKSHMNSIFRKLKVANRTQAVLLAIQMNLTEN